ncbi:MAG TPA: Rne/Rng family ribonuclease [Candidatus Binatia bacterium]|nr:Rne/Rng family ribonuclease [Candidatus Binatia bacterium]
MAKTMLIDATHPEETRVAVVDGKKLEEFDVEIAGRRPLKGNIYLAKVTRVEPSLQACFVEYGGNRHGFLAFSEIHPDYYRIPIADREALIRETQAALDDHEHDRRERPRRGKSRRADADQGQREDDHHGDEHPESDHGHQAHDHDDHAHHDHEPDDHAHEDQVDHDEHASHDDDVSVASGETPTEDRAFESDLPGPAIGTPTEAEPAPAMWESADPAMPLLSHQEVLRQDLNEDGTQGETLGHEAGETDAGALPATGDADLPPPSQGELVEVAVPEEVFDTVGGSEPARDDDPEVDEENARRRRQRALRRYKIQEVIKRRQILLVQVTKEERGNKGAALTTYLSLAGRYCVLMPNTDRGGGISRRITSLNDRKRLKGIVDDLDVPEGMAVIVRTAGSERSKPEVKRDFEYLMRLWDEIRETTLKSSAPALIYEEASLIKRSIRDLYTRDMGDIVVAGIEGYKQAKSFMRMLTPSHAKRVQLYRDASIPLFQRYQVEAQLAAIHNPVVHLRSGGYIVLNQTEALVAIDVNSGRATKERNIEETALKTNAEAAEEIARQLRLRDLAGLIVIDFIDMEEGRNNAAVERRMKESLRNDRARIQIGRISSFGLLEMSRQRLHPSLQEASTEICPHCRGSGRIRSVDSTALHVLRMVEEEITKTFSPGVSVFAPTPVALYILNQKRTALSQLEMRRGVRIYINGDDTLTPPDFRLDRIKQLAPGEELPPAPAPVPLPADAEIDLEEDVVEEVDEEAEAAAEAGAEVEGAATAEAGDEEQGGRGRRRRRRRRGRGGRFSADEFTESAERSGGEAPAVTADLTAPDLARGAEAPASDDVGSAETGGAEESEDEGEEGAGAAGDGDPSRRRRRRGRRGGRRRSRRGQEQSGEPGGAEGFETAGENGEGFTPDTGLSGGEQPAVPEDSEALPPQWRQPAAPAVTSWDHPAEPRPAIERASLPAAEEPAAAPVESSSSPVTMIEIGGPGGESAARAEGSEDSASEQSRRRGWWRRLIE